MAFARSEGLTGLRRRLLVDTGSSELRTADGIAIWPVERFVNAVARSELF